MTHLLTGSRLPFVSVVQGEARRLEAERREAERARQLVDRVNGMLCICNLTIPTCCVVLAGCLSCVVQVEACRVEAERREAYACAVSLSLIPADWFLLALREHHTG